MRRLFLPMLVAALAAAPAAGQTKKEPKPDQVKKVQSSLPDAAPAKPKQPRNILVYSKTAGFRHSSIEIGTRAITLMGDKTGAYTVTATEDESYFEPEKLSQVRRRVHAQHHRQLPPPERSPRHDKENEAANKREES